MNKEYVEELVEKGFKELPLKQGTAQFELERKASTFLLLSTRLAQSRFEAEQDLVRLNSLQTATFASAIDSIDTELKVTEKKAKAQNNKEYTAAREELETLTALITYIKTVQDIFNNAHIFYRNCAKIYN